MEHRPVLKLADDRFITAPATAVEVNGDLTVLGFRFSYFHVTCSAPYFTDIVHQLTRRPVEMMYGVQRVVGRVPVTVNTGTVDIRIRYLLPLDIAVVHYRDAMRNVRRHRVERDPLTERVLAAGNVLCDMKRVEVSDNVGVSSTAT